MTVLYAAGAVAVLLVVAVIMIELLNLGTYRPDEPADDGRDQAERDLEAWRQSGRVRIVELGAGHQGGSRARPTPSGPENPPKGVGS